MAAPALEQGCPFMILHLQQAQAFGKAGMCGNIFYMPQHHIYHVLQFQFQPVFVKADKPFECDRVYQQFICLLQFFAGSYLLQCVKKMFVFFKPQVAK
jgi:hypothetical protein